MWLHLGIAVVAAGATLQLWLRPVLPSRAQFYGDVPQRVQQPLAGLRNKLLLIHYAFAFAAAFPVLGTLLCIFASDSEGHADFGTATCTPLLATLLLAFA